MEKKAVVFIFCLRHTYIGTGNGLYKDTLGKYGAGWLKDRTLFKAMVCLLMGSLFLLLTAYFLNYYLKTFTRR